VIVLENVGDVATLRFDAPDIDAGRESVLTYVADPFGTDQIALEWDLNGRNVLTNNFTSAPARALQEILPKDLLKAHGNKLEVRVTVDGGGSVKLDDVVLLYTQKG